jgi:hypothetical protein
MADGVVVWRGGPAKSRRVVLRSRMVLRFVGGGGSWVDGAERGRGGESSLSSSMSISMPPGRLPDEEESSSSTSSSSSSSSSLELWAEEEWLLSLSDSDLSPGMSVIWLVTCF